MNVDVIVDIVSQALVMIIKLSAPVLLVSLVLGLVISILQTVTSIQEQTLTFVPKLIGIVIILMILGSWMLTSMRDYMIELISNFSYYINN